MTMKKTWITLGIALMSATLLKAQTDQGLHEEISRLQHAFESLNHRLDVLEKNIDDVLWFKRVGDVAVIDKVYMYGPLCGKNPIPPPWAQEIPSNSGRTSFSRATWIPERNIP